VKDLLKKMAVGHFAVVATRTHAAAMAIKTTLVLDA
jgi:hypothetical protein